MGKSGASEIRPLGRTAAALAIAIVLFGDGSKSTASERDAWPSATYYSVVAHPGDTVAAIGARYRVSPSLVARLNGVAATAQLASGRVMLIPARGRATREAVLSEALDRSAPHYAAAPRPPGAPPPLVSFERPDTNTHAIGDRALRSPLPREQGPAFVFSWPIAGSVISSFGPGERGTRNDGINIAAARGAPFRAAADGTVSYVGPLRGYGNLILITHARGYVTAYAHAGTVMVGRGQQVARGQVLGTAGETGGVDRPQLHFEIRRGIKAIDPSLLLAANS